MLCLGVPPTPPQPSHAPAPSPPLPPGERVFVALGGNLGDVAAAFDVALEQLCTGRDAWLVARSPVYRTAPVGGVSQPDFLNAVAEIRTSLEPRALLDRLHAAERSAGRDRAAEVRWGPRPLDLDIILWGSRVSDEPGLTVPHPRFTERLFVLEPLADLAPGLVPPGHTRTVSQLRDALRTVSG